MKPYGFRSHMFRHAFVNKLKACNYFPWQKALLAMDAFSLTLLFMDALDTRCSRKSNSSEMYLSSWSRQIDV